MRLTRFITLAAFAMTSTLTLPRTGMAESTGQEIPLIVYVKKDRKLLFKPGKREVFSNRLKRDESFRRETEAVHARVDQLLREAWSGKSVSMDTVRREYQLHFGEYAEQLVFEINQCSRSEVRAAPSKCQRVPLPRNAVKTAMETLQGQIDRARKLVESRITEAGAVGAISSGLLGGVFGYKLSMDLQSLPLTALGRPLPAGADATAIADLIMPTTILSFSALGKGFGESIARDLFQKESRDHFLVMEQAMDALAKEEDRLLHAELALRVADGATEELLLADGFLNRLRGFFLFDFGVATLERTDLPSFRTTWDRIQSECQSPLNVSVSQIGLFRQTEGKVSFAVGDPVSYFCSEIYQDLNVIPLLVDFKSRDFYRNNLGLFGDGFALFQAFTNIPGLILNAESGGKRPEWDNQIGILSPSKSFKLASVSPTSRSGLGSLAESVDVYPREVHTLELATTKPGIFGPEKVQDTIRSQAMTAHENGSLAAKFLFYRFRIGGKGDLFSKDRETWRTQFVERVLKAAGRYFVQRYVFQQPAKSPLSYSPGSGVESFLAIWDTIAFDISQLTVRGLGKDLGLTPKDLSLELVPSKVITYDTPWARGLWKKILNEDSFRSVAVQFVSTLLLNSGADLPESARLSGTESWVTPTLTPEQDRLIQERLGHLVLALGEIIADIDESLAACTTRECVLGAEPSQLDLLKDWRRYGFYLIREVK